ncbi:MAG: hypothetical protein ACFCU5_09945 [Pleurocapsa sp.]
MFLKSVKFSPKDISISLLSILWLLLFNNIANAKTAKDSQERSLQQKQSYNSNSISNLKISRSFSQSQTQLISSTNDGEPFLRRTPTRPTSEPQRIPLTIPVRQQPYLTSPSITIMTPSGYGAGWGNAGVGIGLQERTRFTEDADGVIGLGFGLGNPRKNIGAQIGISLVDVSEPFTDGAINLKLHRRLPGDMSVATGVQGLTTWGDPDGGSSVYGVVSKRFRLSQDRTKPFSEFYTSLGIGGGQFRSESNINNGIDSVGVFGSLGIRVIEPIGFVTEWTGQDLTIGIPFVPFRQLPIVIIPAVTDITGSAGDGTRFIVGAGYSFSF